MFKEIDENVLLFTSKFVNQKQYWVNRLAGEIGTTEILFEHETKRQSNTTSIRKKINIFFPDRLCSQLMKISKQLDISIYIILLAGLKALIYCYTHNSDIIVFSPINKQKISKNTMNDRLLIRDQIKNEMSFKEIILHVRQSVLEAYANQDYPFENICEYLFTQSLDQVNQSISSIVCSLKNIHDEDNIEMLKGKLSLSFERENSHIRGSITYDAGIYEESNINTISRHYIKLLEQALNDTDMKCSRMPFLSHQEKKQLIIDFNNTKADFPKNKILPRFIEKYADITPGGIAISFTGKTLTYRQLNEKSNQFARVLRNKGVKRDEPVGIILERSPLMVESILAVWKAGGAYIPLEPDYPTGRIRFILEDSQASVLLTDSSTFKIHTLTSAGLQRLQRITDDIHETGLRLQIDSFNEVPKKENHKTRITPQLLLLDELDQWLSEQPVTNLEHINQSTDLAYIIFTSGSTGKPKGAIVEHIGMMNHIYAKVHDLLITGESVVAQNAAHTFDISVWQFFAALTQGGKAIIYPDEVILEPNRLINQVIADNVTILEVVPSYLFVMLDILDLHPRTFVSLRYLLVTGETVKPDLLTKWFEKYPGIKVVNAYGPTEASDDITHFVMDEAPDLNGTPIGKPLQNFNIYIIDENMNLCPVGIKGEIWVSGIGVGRGYINEVEKTSQVFERDHFTHDQAPLKEIKRERAKLYKTGDIGCWFPGGIIQFMGRKDYQIKIHGFRIELEEIENQLVKHPGVKQAAIIAKEDEQRNKYLCAYFVTNGKAAVEEIKEYLQQHLPDYMVPALFVELEQMPLTPTGKIHRKALLDIEITDKTEYIAPRNEIEELLADVMGTVLGRNNPGIYENFFEMGGDSIKAIQIASRMYNAGHKIEMRHLFQYPSIFELAPFVKSIKPAANQGRQSTIKGEIPLTPIQRRFFSLTLTAPHHYNQAVMLYWKKQRTVEEEAIQAVFKKLQEHHDTLRMTFSKKNREIIQINHDLEYPLSLQEYDFRDQPDLTKQVKAMEARVNEIQAGINLETGPLMKLGLFHLDDGDRLLIVLHHLVIDGISWRILLEDLETLFHQYKNGEPFVLPLKTSSYKSWAEKLVEYANSESFLEEKSYWAKLELNELPPIKKDFEEASNKVKDQQTQSFKVDETETTLLLEKVNGAFATEINDILLTALALGLRETFVNKQVLVALEGHGREEILEDIDVSRTIGWFTSLYPVVLNASYEANGKNLDRQIKEIKENLRRIPNKGIGYGILKYLTPDEHKNDLEFKLNPKISFNYLGQFDQEANKTSFDLAKESPGRTLAINEHSEFELAVSGMIMNKQLKMSITYNSKEYKQETIAAFLLHYQKALQRIITYCSTRQTRELTPSDFKYSKLSIEALEQLQKQYSNLIEDIYTLSPMQEGMLFHSLLEEDSSVYFEQLSFCLHGELEGAVVERSLNQLLKRYDILRTAFIHQGFDRPLQVVLTVRQMEVYFNNSGTQNGEEAKKYIREFKAKDRKNPFDLSRDVLMRVNIIKTGDLEYEFIWSFHHILMDGWCIGILIQEFLEIYNSYLENRSYQLTKVTPYRTYIEWIEKRDKKKSKEYWKKYLAFYEDLSAIPGLIDSKLKEKEYIKKKVEYVLSKEKTSKLTAMANKYNVTLNTAIQVIWGILLGKYNDRQDVVFGAVVSGRPSDIKGVESMIGLFINTIPVRINFETNTKFNQLLHQVQERAIDSEPHHYCSLAEIQAESALKQNLFNHILIFENYPIAAQIDDMTYKSQKDNREEKLKLSHAEAFEQTNYDFNVIISPGEKLDIILDYNAGVYKGDFIKRIVIHFDRVLIQVIDNPKQPIEELTLLSGEETKELIYTFNYTEAEYPKEKTIYELFEKQVERTPDNITVIGMEQGEWVMEGDLGTRFIESVSYRELNNRANQLAHLLREKSVQPDNIVGIMMADSIEMMIGILGILKAGGAYLPIDPDYPENRIASMKKASGVCLVLTTGGIAEKKSITFSSSTQEVEILLLEELARQFPGQALENLEPVSGPENLIYIIFTSGSTGKPKGAGVYHRGFTNLMHWFVTEFGLDSHDHNMLLTSLSFDLTQKNLYAPLITKGSLFLPEVNYFDPGALLKYIQEQAITWINCTPGMFNKIVEYEESSDEKRLSTLRYVFLGGEAISMTPLLNWLKSEECRAEIVNTYGPTECTDICASYRIREPHRFMREVIPVGKPVYNVQLFIVNKSLQLVPWGVAGELLIGGEGVGRGYINDKELTWRKFIRFTIWPSSSAQLLYRTGDLMKWRYDGNIEFLGRLDSQVKLRGYRIEPGEIESRLLEHEDIKNAVVLVKEIKETGYEYLFAYFTSGKESSTSQLKAHLAKNLPAHMIPSYFVKIEKIPLTPNGKVDKKALLLYDANLGSEVEYADPENNTEELIAATWKEVLQTEKIGVNDNFFDVGGHSLLVVKMIGKLKLIFQKDIPLVTMFRYPTIRSMAKFLDNTNTGEFISNEKIDRSLSVQEQTTKLIFGD